MESCQSQTVWDWVSADPMVERTQAVCGDTAHRPEPCDVAGRDPELPIAHLPPGGAPAEASEYETIERSLARLLLLQHMDGPGLRRLAAATHVVQLRAGEAVLAQGRVERRLVIVREGKFEILEVRRGLVFRVSSIDRGGAFGELNLMYDRPYSASLVATTDASVWVLERHVFRPHRDSRVRRSLLRSAAEAGRAKLAAWLGSVPLLGPLLPSLRPDEKMALVDAFQEEALAAGSRVIREGDVGDKFYIIKEGEAQVVQGEREVNRLFKCDFFGEQALLQDEPRRATVVALSPLVCLTLDRHTFVMVLGPLQDIMAKEKSPEVLQTAHVTASTAACEEGGGSSA